MTPEREKQIRFILAAYSGETGRAIDDLFAEIEWLRREKEVAEAMLAKLTGIRRYARCPRPQVNP